jgi:CubicO group peptidase (beta-lactamase class C family)
MMALHNIRSIAAALAIAVLSVPAIAAISPSEAADVLLDDYSSSCPAIAVGVIQDGKVIYANAIGYADLEKQTKATTATNFRLASVSKQFTAMGTMMLVEAGKLKLTTSLCEAFPAFPEYGKGITVRHLLNHTSGLRAYERLMPTSATIPLLDRDAYWLLAQEDSTTSPPGAAYNYSNSGYAMLAVIIEKISGRTFASYMKERIFEPLGMTGTVVNERGMTAIANRAYGYSQKDGEFRRNDQSTTSYVCGDGGIYSSIDDMVKWDQALHKTDLVSSAMLEMAFSADPVTRDEKGVGYGFGWMIDTYRGKRCVAHTGNTCGFSNRIDRFLDDRFTVVVLTNRAGTNLDLSRKLADVFLFAKSD